MVSHVDIRLVLGDDPGEREMIQFDGSDDRFFKDADGYVYWLNVYHNMNLRVCHIEHLKYLIAGLQRIESRVLEEAGQYAVR